MFQDKSEAKGVQAGWEGFESTGFAAPASGQQTLAHPDDGEGNASRRTYVMRSIKTLPRWFE